MTARECPLCSGHGPRLPLRIPADLPNAPPYVQCQQCGLVFHEAAPPPAPVVRPTIDAQLHYTSWKLPTNRHRLAWLTRRIDKRHGRAVDIGTRDGSVVKLLSDMGWQAVGYDPDNLWHDYARERLGVEIRGEWFTAGVVGHGTLDLATAYHVLEHIAEPRPWLSEIRDALKPDGYLHVETPNLRRVRATQVIPGHVVLYTEHTLRQMLETVGFRIMAVTEFAPSGNRSYDCLGVLAKRDQPKALHFGLSQVDRSVQQSLDHPTWEARRSDVVPVDLYRRAKQRLGAVFRRIRYHATR